MRPRFALIALASFVMAGVLCPVSHADEITDSIQAALALYQSGDYARAAEELTFTAARIRRLLWEAFARALPAPLPGWTVAGSDSAAGFRTISGSGATRTYVASGREINVRIVDDVLLLQTALALLENPVLIANTGRRLARVGGRKALVEYREAEQFGEIQTVVGGVLVIVSGARTIWPELEGFATAVDYAALEALTAGP